MKIAIVSNGSSLLRLKKGVEIDSHDLVIRQNFYYYFIDPEITGIKVDIWSCAFDFNKYDDEGRSKEVWCARPLKWENGGKWRILPHIDRKRITKDIHEGEYNRISQITKDAGGSNPTTGFLTLKFTQALYPEADISLYGYDFYEPPKHYYDKDFKISNAILYKDHSPDIEKKLVQEGVKNGEYKRIIE